MNNEYMTLEKRCEKEDFHVKLQNNIYCSIGLRSKIKCKYQSDYLDQNELYPCMNLNYCNMKGK